MKKVIMPGSRVRAVSRLAHFAVRLCDYLMSFCGHRFPFKQRAPGASINILVTGGAHRRGEFRYVSFIQYFRREFPSCCDRYLDKPLDAVRTSLTIDSPQHSCRRTIIGVTQTGMGPQISAPSQTCMTRLITWLRL